MLESLGKHFLCIWCTLDVQFIRTNLSGLCNPGISGYFLLFAWFSLGHLFVWYSFLFWQVQEVICWTDSDLQIFLADSLQEPCPFLRKLAPKKIFWLSLCDQKMKWGREHEERWSRKILYYLLYFCMSFSLQYPQTPCKQSKIYMLCCGTVESALMQHRWVNTRSCPG